MQYIPHGTRLYAWSSHTWKRHAFHIPYLADLEKVGECRQMLVDKNNVCENKNWIDFDYTIGQRVLQIEYGILHKVKCRHEGHYVIMKVHCNGTVRTQCGIIQSKSISGGSHPTSTAIVSSKCQYTIHYIIR